MSIWEEHDLKAKLISVLEEVHLNNARHAFGRPYISAYQLAIGLQTTFRTTFDAIDKPVGGVGIGQRNSLAQYLANELSKQIARHGDEYEIEGAFLSNENIEEITFRSEGRLIRSSLVGSRSDMSLFRLRT